MAPSDTPARTLETAQQVVPWYPKEPLTVWALAHLVLNAEPDELPDLAKKAKVPEMRIKGWAKDVIRQVGGSVSKHPGSDPGDHWAWSYVPPARPTPPGSGDRDSNGPQAYWTVYRSGIHNAALTPDECDRAISLPDDPSTYRLSQNAGYIHDPALEERCGTALVLANEAWWRYPYNGVDRMRVQSWGPGEGLVEHYDRWVGATCETFDGTDYLIGVPERLLVSVTLLQDCEAGGKLRLRLKPRPRSARLSHGIPPWNWQTVNLRRGDTIVFSPWLIHEVTPVEKGQRITLRCALDYLR